MSLHPLSVRSSRRSRPYLLSLLLGLSLLIGIAGSAYAGPSEQLKGLKAITAMNSKRSDLRQIPDARTARAKSKASTNVKALGGASTGTPTGNMGNPAEKTILQSDKLSIAKTTDGEGKGGNITTQQAAALNDTMTQIDGSKTTGDIIENGRALIDHQYPSEGGRFVNGKAESTLAFREQLAGNDAIWALGTVNETAEQYAVAPAVQPVIGVTYAIVQGSTAIANTSAQDSSAFNTQISSTILGSSPSTNQQWAVVDSGAGDGTSNLISRSDGLCLARTGQDSNVHYTVVVTPCTGDPSQHWQFVKGPQESGTFLAAPGPFEDAAVVGSAAGTGEAGPLVSADAQIWSFQPVGDPGGSVPTWAVPRSRGFTTGNVTAPYDMSVGDLDGAIGSDGLYHDEAVVAYTDSNDNWAIRVIDYNANTSRLLVTAPSSSILFGKNGSMRGAAWYPGSLFAKIGDFDGNGQNEILAGYQDFDGQYRLSLWRYTAGSRTLTLAVNKDNCNECDGIPFSGQAEAPTLVGGYNTAAVGDFDGDGATDLAVAYATSTKGLVDTTEQTPNLGIVTFTDKLVLRSVEVTPSTLPAKTNLPTATAADATRTSSGLRLQSGVFSMDAKSGYGYQRRELAMAWVTEGAKTSWVLDPEGYDPPAYNGWDRQVQLQFYAVNDITCPSGATFDVCTATTALSSNQPAPVNPYPHDTGTYTMVPEGQPKPDATPLAVEAGAYGGIAANDPPVWGVWILQWRQAKKYKNHALALPYEIATSVVVPWQSATAPDTVMVDDSYITNATSNPMYFTVTAYDRFGDSVILGSPVIFDVDNSKRLEMLAAQPPKHADYLNDKMVSASISSGYYLQTSTSAATAWSNEVTNKNTYSNGGSTGDTAKATLETGLGPFDLKSSAQLSQTFTSAWTGSNTTSATSSDSQVAKITSQAIDDDVLQMSYNDYTVYRYPVLGHLADGTTCGSDPCQPYYEVTIPQSITLSSEATGMSDTDYAPSWQNDNALSYPEVDPDAGAVPLPDLGSYAYIDKAGTAHSQDTPLYNEGTQLGGVATDATLTLTGNTAGSTTTTSGHSWESDDELDVSASVAVGVPDVGGGSVSYSNTNGLKASKTFLNTTMTSNTSTSETAFELKIGEIASGNGYEIGTAVYYSTAGTPKVVHGVDLTNAAYGTYFTNNYGSQSDVSLNLPGRMVVDKDSNDLYQSPYLSTSYARQLVRGFQVLQVANDGNSPPSRGVPFSNDPTSGTQMQFQVPVYNASLVTMPSPTAAHFWAVPVTSLGNQVTGAKIDLGSVSVPALAAQASTTVTSAAWTAPAVTTNQQYRIFVVLDENATMSEVHPLSGSVCDKSVLDPAGNTDQQVLYDLMSTNPTAPDPTGCGQNNQGYGLVTVAPAPTTTSADESTHGTVAKPANVSLDGGGLLDGVKGHERLTTKSSVPVVPLNANLRGLVYAKADKYSTDRQPVLIYDGDPGKGKLIYSGRMPGVAATSGSAMDFAWTPTEPGLHELHTVILGSATAGEDDEQIMRVWVDSKPRTRSFVVTATADRSTVEAGGSVGITGRVTPTVSRADDRDVVLQVKKGEGWATVLEKNTAADGSYAFTVPEPTAGTFVYRIKKNAADGHPTAYSPEVTITVVDGFVVTAKAVPAAIALGQSAKITGTVLPVQSSAADRKVQLQKKTGSTWTRVADGLTSAAGTYAFTLKPTAQGTVSYRVMKIATTKLKAASSPTVTVMATQQFVVTAKASPTTVKLGKKSTIAGTVTPKLASANNRAVQLQLKKGSSWKKVASGRTQASGAYSFSVKPTTKGTISYRVMKPATEGRRPAYSTTVKIKVTGP